MPIPKLNKRSYGFTDRKNTSLEKLPTELPPVEKPIEPVNNMSYGQNKPSRTTSSKKSWLIYLLLLPIKIIVWFFSGLWRLWKKRPRFSKQTSEALRHKLIWSVITLGIMGLLSGTILIAWANKDLPDPNKLTDRRVAESTKIYDRTGEHLLYEIFADKKRTIVELDQIPKQLINGVIATEDKEFYNHHGIRPLSILRAFVYGIITRQRIAGTSTLTQQLVKNAILTNERSYIRKIKEIILSIRLEQKYSKDQILKIYFNEIPYGSTNYGVEAASQSYFGKHVSELNLQECATLAGLPKAPTSYLNNHEALKQRRDFVLRRMNEEGYISIEEKEAAQAEPMTLSQRFGDIKAPHFVLYVKEQLVEKFGEQTVETGGLKVITSLDWDKQEIAEKVVEGVGTKVLEDAKANNLSLVSLDPKTGQILAMLGSKDFNDVEIDGQFNVATLGKRQPGSSFKPIIYAAAFEKGYTPDTILFDVNTDFATNGVSYQPMNYDLGERGPVTMRQALQGSLNIPAVKTLYLVGQKKGIGFSERLGYTTLSEGNFGLSLVLGGGEVKLLEHTSAYGTFANNGVKLEPVSVLRVEDGQEILYEWKKPLGEKVLDPKITATLSDVLSDDNARSYVFGAGSALTLPGRKVATKTGTTNRYVDAWTVGYTPSLVTGVWVGNTNNTPMKQGYDAVMVAAPIWQAFMKESLKDTPAENFPTPPPNNADKPVLRGSNGGSITLEINKITGRLISSSTPENLITERTYIQPHSILHYLDRDNPRGPALVDPTVDPQYTVWENAILDWIKRKKEKDPAWNISFEEPPTLYDDEYSIELMPTLEILSPAPSSTFVSRQISTNIKVSAPRGVTKVTYKIDDQFVSVERQFPFNLNYYARELENGDHSLFIIVEDDIGNRLEQTIPFTLSAGEENPGVFWLSNSETIRFSDFPRSFLLTPFKIDQIAKVIIYAQKGVDKLLISQITDFSDLFNNQIIFNWDDPPETGTWILTATIELNNGEQKESARMTVNVQ